MIAKFADADGHAVLVNPDHVAMVVGVKSKPETKVEGGVARSLPAQWILGRCAIMMANGQNIMVEHSIEEVYGILNRPPPNNLRSIEKEKEPSKLVSYDAGSPKAI